MTYDLTWADEREKPWDQRNHAAHFGWAWGAMRWLIPTMQDLGMVFDSGYDWHKVWPSQVGITDDDWDEEDPAKWSPARARYEATAKAITERRFEYPGIPLHKFDSNDPWRIWPDEILSALGRYRERAETYAWSEGCQQESFGRWIAFLTSAVEHGGCIAH